MASVDNMGMRADGQMEIRVGSSDRIDCRVAPVYKVNLRNRG